MVWKKRALKKGMTVGESQQTSRGGEKTDNLKIIRGLTWHWTVGKITHTGLCQEDIYERDAGKVWCQSIYWLILRDHSQYGLNFYLDTLVCMFSTPLV